MDDINKGAKSQRQCVDTGVGQSQLAPVPERALVAREITKSFGAKDGSSRLILDKVSLAVHPGEIVGLRGPSGAGKSTLGRIIAGLEVPDSGECLCDGVVVGPVRSRAGQRVRGQIGMVFQSPRRSCDPRMTLGRTISSAASVESAVFSAYSEKRSGKRGTRSSWLARHRTKVDAENRRGNVNSDLQSLIEQVGLTPDLLKRFPSQVSDGQLQRAAVARTLAAHPRYLICDEMTAMLDAANSAAIIGVVRNFAKAGGGVLMISHEHRLLDAVCDEIVEFEGSQPSDS